DPGAERLRVDLERLVAPRRSACSDRLDARATQSEHRGCAVPDAGAASGGRLLRNDCRRSVEVLFRKRYRCDGGNILRDEIIGTYGTWDQLYSSIPQNWYQYPGL